MAIPNLELISILRETGNALKEHTYYNWSDPLNCNCGLVARTALNRSELKLEYWLAKDRKNGVFSKLGSWTNMSTDCYTTGIKLSVVFSKLAALGLTKNDINELEYLSNPQVLNFLNVESLTKGKRSHLIQYLEGWADILESSLVSNTAKVANTQAQTVSLNSSF